MAPLHRVLRAFAVCVLPLAVFAAIASVYVPYGELETDEGFYGLAARLAIHGAVPYRDFAFNQTHLFPFLHGALLAVVGFGLVAHRALCAVYAALSLAVIGVAGLRPGRAFGFGLFAWALALSGRFVARASLGQSFSMAALFLLIAGACLIWVRSPRRRTWLVAGFGVAAVACKLTVLPVVALLCGYELWTRRSVEALLAPVVVAALIFAPVIAADPGAWWFWNVGFHLGMKGIDFRSASAYLDHLEIAPAVLLLGVAVLIVARRQRTPAWNALAAGLAGWALQLPLRSTQGEYALLFLPLVALAGAEVLSQRPELGRNVRLAAAALLLVTFVFPFPRVDRTLLRDLRATAELLREKVPLDRPLITSVPVVALESGHSVLAGLEMCPFCVTSELDPAQAERLHLWTLPRLEEASRQAAAIVLTTEASTWDFYWSVPSLRPIAGADRAELWRSVSEARFHPALSNGQFTVMLRDDRQPPSRPFWIEGR